MFYTIYSVFVDSAMFIWKYPYVTILNYLFFSFYWLLGFVEGGISVPIKLITIFWPYLILLLNTVFISLVVYSNEVLSDKKLILWGLAKKTFEQALLLSLSLALFTLVFGFLFAIVLPIVGENMFNLILKIYSWNIVIAYFFGVVYQIFYQNNLVIESIPKGIFEFYKNIIFYVLVYIAGILIIRFPSLLFPITWLTMPFVPLVEGISTSQPSWTSLFWVLIYPILSTLQLVALNFAFLYKNRNKLPTIVNPKSEIVN